MLLVDKANQQYSINVLTRSNQWWEHNFHGHLAPKQGIRGEPELFVGALEVEETWWYCSQMVQQDSDFTNERNPESFSFLPCLWYLQFVLHRSIIRYHTYISWQTQSHFHGITKAHWKPYDAWCNNAHHAIDLDGSWIKLNLICSLKGHIHPKKVTRRHLHKLSTECRHCDCCISTNISTVGNCGGKSCSYKRQPSKQMESAWKTHMCHTFFLATSGLRCQIRHSAVLCSPEWLMQFALEGRDTNLLNGTDAMWIWILSETGSAVFMYLSPKERA